MSEPHPYSSKVAVPMPSEDEVRNVLGERYRPEVLNVTKMLLGTGDCFPPIVALVKALFRADVIDAKVREVITLRVASLLDVPYEWQQNAKMALNVGVSQGEIDAIGADGPVDGLIPDYILVCSATDELVQRGTLQDGTLSGLLKRFGEGGTRSLILAIGYFVLLGMFLNGCRVPLETSDKIGSSTSPLG